MTARYFETLFDPGELICAGDLYTQALMPVSQTSAAPFTAEFVCINPLRDRRLDANVTCHRNLVIENDLVSVDEQLRQMDALALPHTTAVFSGSKSVHFVISLREPCTSRVEYDQLVTRLYRALQYSSSLRPDTKCKNPSRFTRFPGHVRPSTGREQQLLYVRDRISHQDLEAWLAVHSPNNEAPAEVAQRIRQATAGWTPVLRGNTKNLLMFGAGHMSGADRHTAIVAAAFDLCDCGYDELEVIEMLADAPTVLSPSRDEQALARMVRWVFEKKDTA